MREISTNSQALGMFARLRARWSALDAAWRWALALFLGYRVLLSFWLAWVSAVFPQNLPEQLRPVWPVSAPLGAWLERVLLWPTLRYDVLWNIGIAEQGYAYRLGVEAMRRAGSTGPLPYQLPANQAFLESAKALAWCLQQLQKPDMAAEVIEQALVCDPSDPLSIASLRDGGASAPS